MKKSLRAVLLVVVCIMLTLSTTVSAATSAKAMTDISSIQNQEQLQQIVQPIREVHNNVINKGLATINSDGTINVRANAAKLKVDKILFDEYIKSIQNINDIINLGVAAFDENFNLVVKSRDEIAEIIFKRDQQQMHAQLSSGNSYDSSNSVSVHKALSKLMGTTSLPTLYAFSIATDNKIQLISYYVTIAIYDPLAAIPATIGYFVGKVQPGGAWDYKTVPGYTPYYKEWMAVQRYTTSIKTSEWFGNYNYGFTGQFLFSLGELLAAGSAISLLTGHGLDDEADRTAITQGYAESMGIP